MVSTDLISLARWSRFRSRSVIKATVVGAVIASAAMSSLVDDKVFLCQLTSDGDLMKLSYDMNW